MSDIGAAPVCLACGRLLPSKQGRGRRQQYCNATCRSAARRRRSRVSGTSGISVKADLTPVARHDSLDEVSGQDSGASPAATTGGCVPPEPLSPDPATSLAAIAAAREEVAAAEASLQLAVDRARAAGHSWREIGDVLETSRQAAFQRFGRPIDPRTGTPMNRAVLPGATDKAIMIFAAMSAGRWAEARSDFSASLEGRLDPDRLAAGWAQTISMIGSFERMGEPLTYPVGDSTVTDIPLYFEAGERTGRVSFDSDGEVVGLFIRPVSA
jgi:Protein of unknown function (DUF3887)